MVIIRVLDCKREKERSKLREKCFTVVNPDSIVKVEC